MFGYASDETEECMPLTIVLAHKLNAKMAELRHNGTIPWLRPDSKTQVRIKPYGRFICKSDYMKNILSAKVAFPKEQDDECFLNITVVRKTLRR